MCNYSTVANQDKWPAIDESATWRPVIATKLRSLDAPRRAIAKNQVGIVKLLRDVIEALLEVGFVLCDTPAWANPEDGRFLSIYHLPACEQGDDQRNPKKDAITLHSDCPPRMGTAAGGAESSRPKAAVPAKRAKLAARNMSTSTKSRAIPVPILRIVSNQTVSDGAGIPPPKMWKQIRHPHCCPDTKHG
jgi:hypothetical protein